MALAQLDLAARVARPRVRRGPVLAGSRPRILLTTEGTYPYVMGGVSSWCDLLVNGLDEFDWLVLPIVAPGKREPLYTLPPQAREVGRIEVWSESSLPAAGCGGRQTATELPAVLVRHLIGWEGDTAALLEAFIACRRHPADVRRAFRSRQGWSAYLGALGRRARRADPGGRDAAAAGPRRGRRALPDALLGGAHGGRADARVRPAARDRGGLGGRSRRSSTRRCTARRSCSPSTASTCASPTSPSVRGGDTPGTRFANTRLARGLTRSAYAGADVICPVTDANAYWEMGLGIDPEKIRVLYNGLDQPDEPIAPPGTKTVVSVGRIDPLKDIHTLLRVAAGHAAS